MCLVNVIALLLSESRSPGCELVFDGNDRTTLSFLLGDVGEVFADVLTESDEAGDQPSGLGWVLRDLVAESDQSVPIDPSHAVEGGNALEIQRECGLHDLSTSPELQIDIVLVPCLSPLSPLPLPSGSLVLKVAFTREPGRWSHGLVRRSRSRSVTMPRPQKDPFRPLTADERLRLERVSRRIPRLRPLLLALKPSLPSPWDSLYGGCPDGRPS